MTEKYFAMSIDAKAGHTESLADGTAPTDDFREFVDYFAKKTEKSTSRKYSFTVEGAATTKEKIEGIVAESGDSAEFLELAKDLMRCEADASDKVEQLGTEIPQGCFILYSTAERVLLAKVDSLEFIDEKTLRKESGLPMDRHVLKAAIFSVNASGTLDEARIYDSTARMASYWYAEFLRMKPVVSDKENSRSTWDAFDAILNRRVNKSKGDRLFIRNAGLAYFRTQSEFDIEEFINSVVGEYNPLDETINMEGLKKAIRAIPNKKGLDPKFALDASAIRAKKSHIPLHDHMHLVISGDIDALRNKIRPEIVEGRKVLQIESESGYDAFAPVNKG